MLAVYMPIVREAAIAYKDLWNCHKIRKQPNRPNAVTRQLMVLYHYPDPEVKSYRQPINKDFISELEASLEEWGIYPFLGCFLMPFFTPFSYCTTNLKSGVLSCVFFTPFFMLFSYCTTNSKSGVFSCVFLRLFSPFLRLSLIVRQANKAV
jgi:hypothetical protein